jgi:mono/diheme cytochrome c family protein
MKLRIVLFITALTLLGCAGLPLWVMTLQMEPEAAVEAPPPPDTERGREIFAKGVNGSPPCVACHQVVSSDIGFALGPSLQGLRNRAGKRIPNMSAEAYLTDSILHPDDFIVPGYRNIMYPKFADHFSEQDIADLVAYLMTL